MTIKNRDPKLCNKASQEFWDKERELIKTCKGTRDWTIEQQIQNNEFKKMAKNENTRKLQ